MYGCHVLPVPLPAAIADNLSDHRVPAVSMEPISQSHAIQRASVPSWIWHLEWLTIPGFICTKWGPKFVLNFECISGSCVSGWQIVACLAGFVLFVSFSLSFLFCFSFSSKHARQNTEFNRYFSVNRTVNYKLSTPPWSGVSPSLFSC